MAQQEADGPPKKEPLLSPPSKPAVQTRESAYSWLILVMIYIGVVMLYGLSTTVGVFHVIFLDQFGESNAATSWVGSINTANSMFGGMVGGVLSGRFSCRSLMIAGSLMCTAGLATSSLATSVAFLYVSFGFTTGFGIGLAYIGMITCMCSWFDRRLAMASGIATSSIGISTFIYPPIIRALESAYGWRGALLILGGISLQFMVLACLLQAHPSARRGSARESLWERLIQPGMFKNKRYLIMLISYFVIHFGISIFFVHIEEFANAASIAARFSRWSIAVYGLSNCAGRALFGLVGSLPRVDATVMTLVFVSVSGVAIALLPVLSTGLGMLGCCAAFGFFNGVLGYSTIVIIVEYFGAELLSLGYGYILFFVSLGYLFGAPVAGMLYDVTGEYAYSMYVGGTVQVVACMMMACGYCCKPSMYEIDMREEPMKDILRTDAV